MRKKITIGILLVASVFICLPAEGMAQYGDRSYDRSGNERPALWESEQPRRRRVRRNRRNYSTYGYRNYGQYRRTQVGNRRYRLVRRSYWDDGFRRYRWVRLYY